LVSLGSVVPEHGGKGLQHGWNILGHQHAERQGVWGVVVGARRKQCVCQVTPIEYPLHALSIENLFRGLLVVFSVFVQNQGTHRLLTRFILELGYTGLGLHS
jgi:hypothetical protein